MMTGVQLSFDFGVKSYRVKIKLRFLCIMIVFRKFCAIFHIDIYKVRLFLDKSSFVPIKIFVEKPLN